MSKDIVNPPLQSANPSLRTAQNRVTFAELRPKEVVDLGAMPRILRRVLILALKYPARFALATGATLGAAGIALLLPRLLGAAVDRAHHLIGHGPSLGAAVHELGPTVALILALSILRGLLRMVGGYQGEAVSQRVGFDLRLAFFDKLQRLGFDFHDQIHSGDLITRGMLDLEGVRGFIGDGFQRLVLVVMLVSVGSWRLFSTDPLMAALALSFVPVVTWQAARTGLFLRVTWTRFQEKMALLTRTMEENLQGLRVVRAFAAERFELGKFDATASAALRIARYRIGLRALAVTGMQTAFYLAMAIVLWVGAMRVVAGRMTVGELTEILAFMTIVQQPVRQIVMIVNSAARATSSGQRLFEILDRESLIRDRPHARPLDHPVGVLRFEAVEFAYAGGPPVLKAISFEVKPGKTLGIVGAPGSGKSTIAHLIPRFYDVTGGRITLDGHDIRDLTLDSLRAAVTLVAQDSFLFDIRAADNIAYADPEADESRIVAAAESAHIHDHLAGLPAGYATLIGERGVSLSGGQRQRLSIARGSLPEPPVMVLDDSLSAVDTSTEAALKAELSASQADRATITIAHRLSSLTDADEIIVLDRGSIVERGTYAELIALGGQFAALHRLQSGRTTDNHELVPA
jgi:ATP-binding cassette, subfamily B, multidrug efflux pump